MEKESMVMYSLEIKEETREFFKKLADEEKRTLAAQIRLVLEDYAEKKEASLKRRLEHD